MQAKRPFDERILSTRNQEMEPSQYQVEKNQTSSSNFTESTPYVEVLPPDTSPFVEIANLEIRIRQEWESKKEYKKLKISQDPGTDELMSRQEYMDIYSY
jgi:hypothetical protein